MCGIFFSLSTNGSVLPNEETCTLLRNRGPDSFQVHTVQRSLAPGHSVHSPAPNIVLTFVSTVLSLRGDRIHSQPFVDPTTQSVLCWNGEAWKIAGEPVQDNDTELIFQSFLHAIKPCSGQELSRTSTERDEKGAVRRIADVISNITGPFSFVFYDAVNSKLYFSRDCLGRRSLLRGLDEAGNLRICSICDSSSSTHFDEVDTNGVHMIDFEQNILQNALGPGPIKFNLESIQTLPWEHKEPSLSYLVGSSFPKLTFYNY